MDNDAFASPFDAMLYELCVRLGCCGTGSAHVTDLIPIAGRVTADQFVEGVVRIEEMTSEPGSQIWQQLREVFVRHMGADEVDAIMLR